MLKKSFALICSLALVLNLFGAVLPVSAAGAAASNLSLNVRAVNCYDGTLSQDSKLTVQYTDATLGENDAVKMYAQVNQISTGESSEPQEIASLNYETIFENAQDGSEYDQKTAQDKMGAIEFAFPSSLSVTTADDYTVNVWIQRGNEKSSVVTRPINDQFEGANSDWSEVSGTDWMQYIDGSYLISQINMPGTHDSASVLFQSSFMTGFCKTQSVRIDQQLEYGVRYLDMRVDTNPLALEDTSLSTGTTDYSTCHSSYDAYNEDGKTKYTMSQVIKSCYEFLDAHPSEFIYFNVQQDANRDDGAFQTTIHEYIAKHPEKWFVKSYNPTLDEVRGKLVYARRFEDGGHQDYSVGTRFFSREQSDTDPTKATYKTGSARMANATINNQPHEIVYHIQDYYLASASNKWLIVKNALDSNCYDKPVNEYFYNGLNCAPTLSSPENNAKTVNGNFNQYALQTGKRYGWVSFDFVTADMAKRIYATNIKANEPATHSDPELVLHYDFANISNGVVPDLTGNGFDGKLENASKITVDDQKGTVTLKNAGTSRDSGAGVALPSYTFRGTNNKVTLSVWMRPDSIGQDTWFSIGNREGEDGNYGTRDNWLALITQWNEADGGGPRWASRSKGCAESKYNSQSGRLTKGAWQLLTYVLDGAELKIYQNDKEIGSTSGVCASFDDVGQICPISLGRATHWPDANFNGAIGDFKIFRGALTQEQVAAAYEAIKPSSNTNITSVTVDGVSASRDGDAFSVTVKEADTHDVQVQLEDEKASYVYADGKITVTAEDESTKTYTLTITEDLSANTDILSVTVDGVEATREGDTFTVTVEPKDTHDVQVQLKNEKASFVYENGKITVTAEDGETVKEYTLTITEKSGEEPGGTTPGGTTPGGTTPGGTTGNVSGGTSGGVKPGGTKPDQPSASTPKNGTAIVGGKLTLYKNGAKVTGTRTVTIGKVTYAVKGGVVQAASAKAKFKVVNLGKKSYVVDTKGVIQKKRMIKVGKRRYVVAKSGVIQKAKKKYATAKVGKKTYIVNKKGYVQMKKKTFKVGKASYKVGKNGVAKKKK